MSIRSTVNVIVFAMVCPLGGCAKGTLIDDSSLSHFDCSTECARWVDSYFEACTADERMPEDCAEEKVWRSAWCDELTLEQCTDQLKTQLLEGPPEACAIDTLTATHCEGAIIVGTCDNGRRAERECDDRACPQGTTALGCRLNDDNAAFCECACVEGTSSCRGKHTRQYCQYSETITEDCDESCAAAGYGPSAGCETEDDASQCTCEPFCSENYCDGSTLMWCSGGDHYEAVACSDEACREAGFSRFAYCGTAPSGDIACLCD